MTFTVLLSNNEMVPVMADDWRREGNVVAFFAGNTCNALFNINNISAVILTQANNQQQMPNPTTPEIITPEVKEDATK